MAFKTLQTKKVTRPITPDEIIKPAEDITPETVLDVVNKLIAAHYSFSRKSAIVTLKEIKSKYEDKTKQKFNDEWWNTIPIIYKNSGWNVRTDSPSWDESYDSYYTFEKPK